MSKLKKILLIGLLSFLFVLFVFFFVGKPAPAKEIKWGVNFSQKHTEYLGLDWQETYLALLDDLGVKRIKLITHWDKLEGEKDRYNFDDLDWQIKEAVKRKAEILLVIGMKTPRWPECHLPEWVVNLSKEEQQKEVLELTQKIVLRYRDLDLIWAWQVENEPFFPFGECPWADMGFVKKEASLVRTLDTKKRPIVISDSGEGSFWIRAAFIGDIVGTTMYKKVWFRQLKRYVSYPTPEIFYYRKAKLIEKLFGKKVICVELQTEPWGPRLLYDSPLEEQEKTMNLEQFKKVINFARGTGLDEFYCWGAEWWYWLKTKQGNPEIWEEAGKLFSAGHF